MSRIGKKPIQIPAGVTVDLQDSQVKVKGPKGSLELTLHPHVRVERRKDEVLGDVLDIKVKNEESTGDRSLWGLSQRLVSNLVEGTTKGYEKSLEFVGVGYKVSVAGKTVKMDVGFSHEVDFPIPAGIEAKADKNTLILTGIDKQLVGETAARIRRIRKPEPYKGKGIKYSDEVIRRKAGKAAKAAGAK
jgi:large subunit ribosomal protein L6